VRGGTVNDNSLSFNISSVSSDRMCRCGCGQIVNPGRTYIWGHHARLQVKKVKYVTRTSSLKGCTFDGRPCKKCGKVHKNRTGSNNASYNPKLHEFRLCACGCGMPTNSGKIYIVGHNSRTDAHRVWLSESNKIHKRHLGKRLSLEIRKKYSMLRQNRTESEKERFRKKCRERAAHQVFPYVDTKPEKIFQSALSECHVDYKKHKFLDEMYSNTVLSDILRYHKFDVVIESHLLLIEIDGCYWHACESCGFKPIYKSQIVTCGRDTELNNFFSANPSGWKLVRFWEHELRSIADAITTIKNKIPGLLD
jgi:G:T-mismatch repair DNA endonuclease (very short patch repair protein)